MDKLNERLNKMSSLDNFKEETNTHIHNYS